MNWSCLLMFGQNAEHRKKESMKVARKEDENARKEHKITKPSIASSIASLTALQARHSQLYSQADRAITLPDPEKSFKALNYANKKDKRQQNSTERIELDIGDVIDNQNNRNTLNDLNNQGVAPLELEAALYDWAQPAAENLATTIAFPPPTSVKDIRSFLGHAGFYRRFIKEFFKIASPLCKLLENDNPFVFSDDCRVAFEELKKRLVTAPIIVAPD
nr:uncharacterized protein LOC108943944 [Nicotiana tomentosiformis]